MLRRNHIGLAALWTLLLTLWTAGIGCHGSPKANETKFLNRGRLLMSKNDFARAILEFKNAAKAMPADAEPYYQLGLAYAQAHSYSEAFKAFRKATELNPKDPRAQLHLAGLMTASKDQNLVADAISRLKDLLQNSPNNAEASDTLAVAELELGQTSDASKRLQDTLQKFPADLQASVNLAMLKLSQKDIPGVLDVLQKAVASAPKSPQAALALAQAYLIANDPAKADAEIRRAVQLDPTNGTSLAALASLQLNAGQMDEADKTYRRLAVLPDPRYRHLHAVFLFQTGKRDAALIELQKLANADPNDKQARTRLVDAYIEMHRLPDAESILSTALKKNPNDLSALFQQSRIDLESGKSAEAEKHLKQVVHFRPDSAEVHFALAAVYRAEDLPASERQELSEALRIQPSGVAYRVALARNFTVDNKMTSALDVLDQAPREQKDLAGVMAERNWALLGLNRNREVEAALARIPAESVVGDLLLQRAVVELRKHQYAAARQDAENVLKGNPGGLRAAAVVMQSYDLEGQRAKGLARLSELAAERPKYAPAYYLLGNWYLTAGDTAAARKAYESAKSAQPGFIQADLALAEVDRREHQLDSARRRLADIVRAYPNNTAALVALAEVQKESGDRTGATATYKSVLAIDSSNLAALSGLGDILAATNPDAALEYVQKAGELAPDNPRVQDSLGYVYYRKGLYKTALEHLKPAMSQAPTPQREYHLGMAYLKSGDKVLGDKLLAEALKKDANLPKEDPAW